MRVRWYIREVLHFLDIRKGFAFWIYVLLNFSGFATTWFSQGATDATVLANWNSVAGGGGSTPASFATAGDTWTFQSAMTLSIDWVVAGHISFTTGSLTANSHNITLGGNW